MGDSCGALGPAISIECDALGGEYALLGVACLLVGLVAASLLTRT